MLRKPVVSGMFYEDNKISLKKQIENSFLSDFGPGKLPDRSLETQSKSRKIIGAISPHAGYFFSGACASHVYKELGESKKPDTILILSPNHTALGSTSLITTPYQTPFGNAKIDVEFASSLLKNCKDLKDDIQSHLNEHSLEVQLPFLQYLYGDNLRIVPLVVSSPYNLKELADGISKSIENYNKTDKEVAIISSSDFTHYGPNYDFNIFMNNIKENIKNLDQGAINYIKKLDYKGFIEYVTENNATICGYLPISVMIRAIQPKVKEVKVLKYYMSSDIMPDKENSVSYASIVFYG